jgi:hypothetical protein
MTAETATPIKATYSETTIRAAIIDALSGVSNISRDDTGAEALHQIINQVAASPLVESAADTLEAGGGSAWEPARPPKPISLWTNLRPTQAQELIEMVEAACARAEERCTAIIAEEIAIAGATFAAKYPSEGRDR